MEAPVHDAPLIDAHTHFFSRPFFEALAGQSPQPGSVAERLAALTARTGLELPATDVRAHTARWVAALDAAGVQHAVTFASLPQEATAVAQAVRAAQGRLTGYVLVNPLSGMGDEITRAHFEERGFKGVLLFPAMHHYKPNDPACRAVLEVVAEKQGVAVVHCGLLQVKLRDLLGLPRPFDLAYASPLDVIPAANAFPEARFVIPHFGAGLFRECLMAGVMCENVYVDTSSSNAWMATQPTAVTLAEVFGRTLAVFGAERVLFGTDSSTFPRGWRADLLADQREALAACGASAKEQALVLGGNAARLLALDGA